MNKEAKHIKSDAEAANCHDFVALEEMNKEAKHIKSATEVHSMLNAFGADVLIDEGMTYGSLDMILRIAKAEQQRAEQQRIREAAKSDKDVVK